ncbi:transposase [Pseudomonas sp. GB2N2]
MRARIIFTTLCAAVILAGCAPTKKPSLHSYWSSDQGDALPTDIPLPIPGINERPVVGTKTVLVMVVHWSDGDELNHQLIKKQTLSTDQDSLQTYISVASQGKLNLTGQVIEGTSIPRPDSCKGGPDKPVTFALEEGKKIAIAQGINPNNFDYLISVISCGGGAIAHTPGNIIVVFGQPGSAHVFKHEFGHNLGYNHVQTYTKCQSYQNTVWAPVSCTAIANGDSGDPLSGGSAVYPANNLWYSGWLSSSQMNIAERTGRYVLARSGSLSTLMPKLILINRSTSPKQIALELRQANHMYGQFPPSDNRVRGVWVRFTDMTGTLSNYQLDASPGTPSTDDPTLQPGQTLRDSQSKTDVKVCRVSEEYAELAIALNNEPMPSCD